MRHAAFRMFSLASLIVLGIIAGMWVRTYWFMDRYSYRTVAGFDHKIRSDVGRFSYFYITNTVVRPDPPVLETRAVLNALPSTELIDAGGFLYEYEKIVLSPTWKLERFFLIVPYWSLAMGAGALPMVHYLRYRRGRIRARLMRLATGSQSAHSTGFPVANA